MIRPISQYSRTNSALTDSTARVWAAWMRPFTSASNAAKSERMTVDLPAIPKLLRIGGDCGTKRGVLGFETLIVVGVGSFVFRHAIYVEMVDCPMPGDSKQWTSESERTGYRPGTEES